MTPQLIVITLLAAICTVHAKQTNAATIAICPNVGLFHIDSLKESELEGRLFRDFRLSMVRQIKGSAPAYLTFRELGQKDGMNEVGILGTLIRQVGFRMTPSTLKDVDQLLKSDKLSDDQKRGLNDKSRMRTEEFK